MRRSSIAQKSKSPRKWMKMGDVARGWLGELPAYLLHLGGAQPKTSREPGTYCSSVASCRRAWVRHLVTPNQQIYPCIPRRPCYLTVLLRPRSSSPAHGEPASARAFIYQTGLPAGSRDTMLAVFGALTKAGHIRNYLVNSKGDTNADVIDGVEQWFDELINNANWAADRVGGGLRVNPEALAKAIAVVKNELHDGAHQKYLDRVLNKDKVLDPGDKAGKKEILYSTFALRNKAVEAEYNRQLPQHAAAPDVSAL